MTRTTTRFTSLILAGSAALLLATAPAFAQTLTVRVGQSRVGPYDDPGNRDGRWRQGHGFNAGFGDGVREGRDAARDGRRFDPYRASRYRSANHGYHGRYGPRDYYRQDYRDGFYAGYERGYREARHHYGDRRQWSSGARVWR